MTQGMVEQQELLTRLVEVSYDCCGMVVLQPISPYLFEDRGIYRVNWEDGTSSVLRAFFADVTVDLTEQAAVLDYLQQCVFEAPQVRRTSDGKLLAFYAGWTALLVSFLEGGVAGFALDSLEMLAECTGRLHTLSHNVLVEAESTRFPDSRLRPTLPASLAIGNLVQALPHVPDALHLFCEDSIVALQRVQQAQQAGLLPEMIIHGDCWPGNAVRTHEGGIALIDWDCAGIGPAILDVGYLLLTCHLGKPQLPDMQVDEHCIAAVVRGYCRHRRLNATELSVLEEAVLYDVARRAGVEKRFSALSNDWAGEIWLQKMLVRYRISTKIAATARYYFEQENFGNDPLLC